MLIVMIRKRLVLFFDLEVDKKVDNFLGGKRRVLVVALLEKMFRKVGDLLFFIADVVFNKLKLEYFYVKDEKEFEKEGES